MKENTDEQAVNEDIFFKRLGTLIAYHKEDIFNIKKVFQEIEIAFKQYKTSQSQEKTGWISVKDNKPQYYAKVLACNANKRHIVWRANDGEKDLYTIDNSDEIIEITHWQNLPQPPTQKE